MLKANSLTLGYNKQEKIINNVSLPIEEKKITTLIGTNGCGKSTLLKALSRSLKPIEGTVYLDNESIFKMNTKKLARIISVLPQAPKVPDDFSAYDLVSFGRFPHLKWSGKLTKKDLDIIDWAISKTKIEHLKDRNLTTLSGGERQRTWIAMALAQQPKYLILDEPTTYLDISYQYELLDLVKELNKTMHLTIVMVLHDLYHAARYSDKIIVVKDGKIFKQGTPEEIITEETLKDVFNIQAKIFYDSANKCPFFIPQTVNN